MKNLYLIRCRVKSGHAIKPGLSLLCLSETDTIDMQNLYALAWSRLSSPSQVQYMETINRIACKGETKEDDKRNLDLLLDTHVKVSPNGLNVEVSDAIVKKVFDCTMTEINRLRKSPDINIFEL